MVELDAKNKTSLVLSFDAFYLLYCGEEPLIDPASAEAEAKEIQDMFPHGFYIEDNYEYVEDMPGFIEANFIPYRPSTFLPDAYDKLTNEARLEIRYLDNNMLEYRLYNDYKGEIGGAWERNVVPIETNKFKLRFFTTRGGSVFFLRNFIKA